ncbi:MAG TPA: ABC transporter permease [Bryobacteraceae bacterium]|jgi:predicted permease
MSFVQDVKYGIRMLVREPWVTAVMVAALALGIGVNTTVFTLVNAVLFRGLPFDQPDRIMYISSSELAKNRTDAGASFPDYLDWQAQSKSFQGLAAFSGLPLNIADDAAAPERYSGAYFTPNAFSMIGQKPMLGRDFLPEEGRPGAALVCIIGYGVWENRYGRDPNILGKHIRVNEKPATIVGVMPKGMKFPVNADAWLPLVPEGDFAKRGFREMSVFGRLADGVSAPQARKEMELIAQRLEKAYPDTNRGITPYIASYNDQFNGGRIRTVFLVLLGAVGFVLLIACANVANLMLARALARVREVSIRTALGASRWRVIRQLLVESVLVGILGGTVGLCIAVWGVRMFDLAVANVDKPYWIVFRMDFTVFAYLAAICVFTGILFGLAPAIQLSRVDLNSTLKEGGRGSTAARSRYLTGFLVVSEVALSIVLLVGSGLMIRSFLKLYGMANGLHPERFMTMRLNLPREKYPKDDARLRFYDAIEQRIASVPGVESAAITSNLPINGAINWKFELDGDPHVEDDKRPGVSALVVSPGYFQTIGVAVVRGRSFVASDGVSGKEAVIVNQRFVAKYLKGEDPIGKRVRILWDGDRPWLTVVGVAQDFRQIRPEDSEIVPLIYVPYRQKPLSGYGIVARTAVNPGSLSNPMRREVQAIDRDLPVFAVQTLQENFEQQRWPFRVFGTLFAIFAGIALLLSSVGLYAVMAYSVTRRTQEIGVRIALGASAGMILRLVLAQGMRHLALGVAIGLAAALGLARVMTALLVQITPTDPVTFLSISALLIAVGVFACWLPARGAMKVDPMTALRYE